MNDRAKERAAWVTHWTPGRPKALLTRIRADGDIGTNGDRGRREMTNQAADHMLAAVERSGVGSTDGRRYLIDLLRWHYGYSASRSAPPASTARLDPAGAAFVRRRAHELLREHPLPGVTITHDRQAT